MFISVDSFYCWSIADGAWAAVTEAVCTTEKLVDQFNFLVFGNPHSFISVADAPHCICQLKLHSSHPVFAYDHSIESKDAVSGSKTDQ